MRRGVAAISAPDPSTPKILLVDDQRSIRMMARRALEEAGFADVTEATNGEEALSLLREGSFDLIISDLNMDPVDGLALLTAIRGDFGLAATPFILMTGKLEDEDARRAEDEGVNETMTKPFDAEAAREIIARVLAI